MAAHPDLHGRPGGAAGARHLHGRGRDARAGDPERRARGDVITKQGNTAHWLYIGAVGEGEVLDEPPQGAPQPIGKVGPGEIFGEMALVSGEARSATVIAKSDVECYRLDRASFQELLGNRPEIAE